MKSKIIAVFCILLFSVSNSLSFADSLWNKTLTSPYSSVKPIRKGDIVMVLIMESTSAVQKAGTDTSFRDDLGVDYDNTVRKLSNLIGSTNSVKGSLGNTYKGSGVTSRSNNVLAAVAVTVTKIMPNGLLKVYGTHKVAVNDETQEISVDGTIRPSDVTDWNTIYSYQVADAIVKVQGRGAVHDAGAPGLITRLLNLIF